MNTELLQDTLNGSMKGALAFPDVVRILTAEAVESYRIDFVRREAVFYMPNGETHVMKVDFAPGEIAEPFSAAGVLEAIRASQAGQQTYPEFVQRAMRAGTTGYVVFLTGRKCIYFGRKGEFHIEEFPALQP